MPLSTLKILELAGNLNGCAIHTEKKFGAKWTQIKFIKSPKYQVSSHGQALAEGPYHALVKTLVLRAPASGL
jgi:hypothetical protein